MTPRRAVAPATRREAVRARIARRRADDEARRRRRRWLFLLLLLLILLLLLRCRETPPPPPPAPSPPASEALAPAPTAPEPIPPPKRVARRDRPKFEVVAPEPLPWLTAFRLQVAARSPRLAECFVGAGRPGALKWTVAVEPRTGRVADPTLEPTLSSDELTSGQRECVLATLSDPPYRLDAGDSPATPSRVGMVIEF